MALLLSGIVTLLACDRAVAATADGALLTNVASATFQSLELNGTNNNYLVSFNATAYVLVASPNIQLQKTANPTVACSGGTVTFCIYAVNASLTTSAFNVTLWDKYTQDYVYVAGGQAGNWTNTTGSTITKGFVLGWTGLNSLGQAGTGCGVTCNGPSYGAPQSATPCPCPDNWGVEPAAGTGGPVWMKWIVTNIGPGKSAGLCFQVQLQ